MFIEVIKTESRQKYKLLVNLENVSTIVDMTGEVVDGEEIGCRIVYSDAELCSDIVIDSYKSICARLDQHLVE